MDTDLPRLGLGLLLDSFLDYVIHGPERCCIAMSEFLSRVRTETICSIYKVAYLGFLSNI